MRIFDRLFRRRPQTPAPADETASASAASVASTPAERKEWTEFLGRCRFFSDLSRRAVESVASEMHAASFPIGTVIMRQGERGDSLMVVREGRLEVRVRRSGGDAFTIAQLGPRDAFGEMALLTQEPRTADVVAIEAVQVLVLPASAFQDVSRDHPEFPVLLTELLAERLGQSSVDGLGEKRLSGYRILRCLGKGGMAVVYEAEDTKGKHVALKMMSHRLVFDSDALRRFQREADLAQSFHHDKIARVYSRFEAYRTYFLVMELCVGPTLRELIRARGPLEEPFVRAVLGQLAGALKHVHEAGVLHRDLKPSNVILHEDGSVKLTDFGLALPIFDIGLTRSGMIVGTPSYMAPEQLAGKELDERIDIYALGCTALEMLQGKPVFDEADFTALIYQKLTYRLPPRETIGADLSSELYDVLRRSLGKTPEERDLDLDAVAKWAKVLDPGTWADIQRSMPEGENREGSNGPATKSEARPG
jgi:CRP-like cAMP-binding protein